MDKSREQFLVWFSKEYEEVNNSTELSAQVIKMIASAAWQASRAAVEIEIPEVLDYWIGREGFAESIRAAGLKVKGE
ncbi:hypothetical protein ROK90_05415 [Cronobacter dublinensis]|uniref:hypothetical protein n=1 Tax=Cronobacter dublinensis TaxID=413497 RepID=UPI002893A494|nr:hypothetical protein [Cronobacter dublinensis]MDT3665454.1 hypothetical protein [Cronobacter dublinensis]